jgi:hypothetical protein
MTCTYPKATVSSTRLSCPVCEENLLRIHGAKLKDDEVLCLSCRGHGNFLEVSMGADLVGRTVTPAQLHQLNAMVSATAREYGLSSL